MLIKEYRIPMPLSVEEYRIAQLYMIQKKSREESQGTESGVEIIENQPYTDGPGGNGQYTQKIYHISKHIPGWLVSLLPKDALIVEEQAWNAYPYTRTRYTCPFVEKFSIDIETRYFNDAGESENAFDLSSAELRSRVTDEIDIVKEHVSDYKKEEDPKIFISKRTGRGPLNDDWLSKTKSCPQELRGKIMCAYKRCKVEFKYWGMQSKIEKFIHDTGLRKVMLRAHKQAWCWQDEWFGLTMEDIRRLEKETQLALRLKFGSNASVDEDSDVTIRESDSDIPLTKSSMRNKTNSIEIGLTADTRVLPHHESNSSLSRHNGTRKKLLVKQTSASSMLSTRSKRCSRECSPSQSIFSDGRIEGIRRYSTDTSSDEDEFFDAADEFAQEPINNLSSLSGYQWGSSIENLADETNTDDSVDKEYKVQDNESCEIESLDQNETYSPAPCKIAVLFLIIHGGNALESSHHGLQSTKQSDLSTLQTTFESVINTHYKAATGRVAMRLVACPVMCSSAFQLLQNLSPFGHDNSISHEQTLPSSLVSLFATSSSLYNEIIQSLAVSCNLVYNTFADSKEGRGFNGQVCVISDTVGSILGYDMLCKCTARCNSSSTYSSRRGSSLSNHEEEDDEFVSSVPGSPNFKVLAPQNWEFQSTSPLSARRGSATPSLGGIDNSLLSVSLGRNTLQPSMTSQRRSSTNCMDIQRSSSYSGPNGTNQTPTKLSSQQYNSTSTDTVIKLDFEVSEFFMFGSPLGLILAMRQIACGNDSIMTSPNVASQKTPPQPACHHIYNLFYTADPSSARIEPLLDMRFSSFPPAIVAKYQMFPLGDGQSISIGDLLTTSNEMFSDTPQSTRRLSEWSLGSGVIDQQISGNLHQKAVMHDSLSITDDGIFKNSSDFVQSELNLKVANRWWGEKRIDFALFYPEALSDFPSSALPHLFHSSFWESTDVAAFVLRQVVKHEHIHVRLNDGKEQAFFTPTIPREKWLRKRTHVKLRNVTANHRAKDCIALENHPQVIHGRFMYGPLDMVTLTGEKIDIYVMTQPPLSEWIYLATEVTNSHGKVACTLPEQNKLGLGIYPVKMVVRGDHTSADSYLAVLSAETDCVIFSIDGSFTASMSIMGSDPKVRPGAVDVVRLWQDMGYMIIYVTGRPDMQKHRVVTWLAQHNFPHGLVWFGDGLSHDPLKQKTILLKNMKTEYKLNYAAGYGSSKDIGVYSQLGLDPHRIYIVGKTSKKQAQQCSWLSDGYSVHLSDLMSSNGVAAAKFNSQVLLRKGCFGFPGQFGTRKNRSSLSKKKRGTFKTQSLD